jgi:thiamine-phosphate diphosphorylase
MIPPNQSSPISAPLMCLTRDHANLSHFDQVKLLLENGAQLIQLRCKTGSSQNFLRDAARSTVLGKKRGATILINDSPEIAKVSKADGVHLGQSDSSPVAARSLLGPGCLIGRTVHSVEEAIRCKKENPDYVGVGPFRRSETKQNLKPQLSSDEFKEIFSILHPIPIFLIGGLTGDDFSLIDEMGITGLAICSALWRGKNHSSDISEMIQLSKSTCTSF